MHEWRAKEVCLGKDIAAQATIKGECSIMHTNEEKRMITVFGEGTVKTSPDIVQMILSVTSKGKDLAGILKENALRMNQVIQSLKMSDVAILAELSIQTIDFQIRQVYDYVNGEQQFQGYEVVNTISVTSNDLGRAGELVDLAVKKGVNQIGSIEFKMQDQNEQYQQALALALQDAEAKMNTMATSLRFPNVPVLLTIEEQQESQPIAFRALGIADTGNTPIESGTITVNASLKVQYEIVS